MHLYTALIAALSGHRGVCGAIDLVDGPTNIFAEIRVIGQIVCPVVRSFSGVGVSGLGVEFVPVDAGAVSRGDAVGLPRALRA